MHNNLLKTWLIFSALMVIIMVFVGGWTRLADAGLSIVEWKPITGIIPPITANDWEVEFNKYKASPEFQKLHNYFGLEEFKKIFWLEYIHRILGRITGLVILIPMIIFWYKKYFTMDIQYFFIPILLLLQGIVGWWMVKSGLVDKPYVSHFRLAFHLITALLLYSVIFWKILQLSITANNTSSGVEAPHNLAYILLFALFMQIFFGALVAGLDAGMIYNSFPYMGERLIPSEFELSWALFYDPASVQFIHRMMGYFTAIIAFTLSVKIYSFAPRDTFLLITAIIAQILLGIFTLLYIVPLHLALAHQLFAVLLLSLVLYILFKVKNNIYQE